jgi:hypothetical protein
MRRWKNNRLVQWQPIDANVEETANRRTKQKSERDDERNRKALNHYGLRIADCKFFIRHHALCGSLFHYRPISLLLKADR